MEAHIRLLFSFRKTKTSQFEKSPVTNLADNATNIDDILLEAPTT